MNIIINDENVEISVTSTITMMLDVIKVNNSNGTAIAVNHEIIPKSQWTEYALKENDNIIIIEAVQGG